MKQKQRLIPTPITTKNTYMPEQYTTFAEEINRAQHSAMSRDPGMIAMGLGIDDPGRIFGTTKGLVEAFGNERVFDMPTAENGMTGVGIGAAQAGTRVLMTHQRVDFFLLAMDQLVNNAAKWHYMFNGQMKVPLTIRLVVGRGWGQGPTHAQNLMSWFAHVPGLKVIVPGKADAVGQQLYQAIMDDNPTVFIEHRWLHQQTCERQAIQSFDKPSEAVRIHREGRDITLVANSYMLVEALQAGSYLAEQGISCEILETTELNSNLWQNVTQSVKKTGRLLVCDAAHKQFSVASELVTLVCEQCFSSLTVGPKRLALPDYPEPTSRALTKDYYNCSRDIIKAIAEMLKAEIVIPDRHSELHDVPGDWFSGPF